MSAVGYKDDPVNDLCICGHIRGRHHRGECLACYSFAREERGLYCTEFRLRVRDSGRRSA